MSEAKNQLRRYERFQINVLGMKTKKQFRKWQKKERRKLREDKFKLEGRNEQSASEI